MRACLEGDGLQIPSNPPKSSLPECLHNVTLPEIHTADWGQWVWQSYLGEPRTRTPPSSRAEPEHHILRRRALFVPGHRVSWEG